MALRKRDDLEARAGVDVARMAKMGAGSLLYVAMVIGALILVLLLSLRVGAKWDLSGTDANSLSPQTLEVLAALEDTVTLHALFPRDDEIAWEAYWMQLKRYREASDRIAVEFLDPVERPGRVRELGVDPRVEDLRSGGLTLATRGDRRLTFRGTDEESITNAVLEVGRDVRRVVGFVRGVGERDPDSGASAGMTRARMALETEYYEVVDVDLGGGVPAGITVLVLAGPTLPLPDDHRAALTAWLQQGGRLLAMVDPGHEASINEVLAERGLRFRGSTIVDARNFIRDGQTLRIEDFPDHEVGKGFGRSRSIALPIATPVDDFETGEGTLFHSAVARSSDFSKTIDADGKMAAGPFGVAAASWQETDAGEIRVLAVGDSDFVSNTSLAMNANRNFFLNCIAWLGRDQALITVRKSRLEGQVIELDRAGGTRIVYLLLIAPAAVVLTGIFVALRRRGR